MLYLLLVSIPGSHSRRPPHMAEPLAATSPEPNGAGSASTAAAGPTALDRLLGTADFIQDPYPVYRRFRHEDPVHWCAPWGAWVVTRHPDVMEVLRRVEDFSSAGYELELLAEGGPLEPGRLPALRRHYSTAIVSTTDPPAHTRLRRLLVKQFTPGVVESLRPRVSLLIADLLDGTGCLVESVVSASTMHCCTAIASSYSCVMNSWPVFASPM